MPNHKNYGVAGDECCARDALSNKDVRGEGSSSSDTCVFAGRG